MKSSNTRFFSGNPIAPSPIPKDVRVGTLVDHFYQAFNAGRLTEVFGLYTQKMRMPDVTIGMSLTGALTPAGLGGSCVVPLIKAGFVDWIVSQDCVAQGGIPEGNGNIRASQSSGALRFRARAHPEGKVHEYPSA